MLTQTNDKDFAPRENPFSLDYETFLDRRTQLTGEFGFAPLWMPDSLFDFQAFQVDWAIRRGRGALYNDCGLGKSPMQLVWAQNVVQHTNRPVLLTTPLSVSSQMVREGEKFGVECHRSQDGKFPSRALVVVTNYDRLDRFDPADFAGIACDESACIKNFDGVRAGEIIEFTRKLPFRLFASATPAPNDFIELGTTSEALGDLGYMEMLGRFFKAANGSLHPFHTGHSRGMDGGKFRFRGHAQKSFWRWVCSWARAARKPSDLGFDDGRFILPELIQRQHVVEAHLARAGCLFDTATRNRAEELEEARRTLTERCEKVAELVSHDRPAATWCHLNPEGDLLTRLIPGAVQVKGGDSDEKKEEAYRAFETGEIRVLVTKPEIAGWGMNWQHCAHTTFFPSHSFEQVYQCVRRFWRFGQTQPVTLDMVTTTGQAGVLENLQRKEAQAAVMFAELIANLQNELGIKKVKTPTKTMEVPKWL